MDEFGEIATQNPEGSEQDNQVILESDALTLNLDDDKFIKVMDGLIKESREFFDKRELKQRRDKNEEYYLGRQIDHLVKDGKVKDHQARYSDNVIYDSTRTLKAVAVSRVPDLLIKPGNDTDESREIATDITDIINGRMRKRETRLTLGKAFRHRPIYFTGIIKPIWDDETGKHGDYKYEVIHPRNVDVDHTATSNDADEMSWIAHHYELTVKEVIMKWPNKKDELYEALRIEAGKKPSEQKLASKIKISEIWFEWYEKEDDRWSKIHGVAWRYKDVIFDKIKNPYWDWEGESHLFTYDNELGRKRKITTDDVVGAFENNVPIQKLERDVVFHNHFQYPKKPFIFLGYDQLGLQPFDETTAIEQSLYLQDNINKRGQQITDLASTAKGKNVFSSDSGLDAGDIETIDMTNPDQDILVDGKLNEVYTHLPGNQPTAALFQDQDINRNRAFSKMGVNSALQGERQGENTATQTQLFKESDYTRIDDEVEDTINHAAELMADWAMQFMKLFYTEDHLISLKGADGSFIYKKINRDLIEDGMEVEVSASAVDKLRRKREAFELANIGMIDPLSFFQDIEASDPEGRAEKLFMFQASPMEYFQRYIQGRDVQQMAMALGAQQPPQGNQPTQRNPTQAPNTQINPQDFAGGNVAQQQPGLI